MSKETFIYNLEKGEILGGNDSKTEGKKTKPGKTDWLGVHKEESAIGVAGEEFVLEVEKMELLKINKTELAESVEHVSKNKGDGYGYDILSFGSQRGKKNILK